MTIELGPGEFKSDQSLSAIVGDAYRTLSSVSLGANCARDILRVRAPQAAGENLRLNFDTGSIAFLRSNTPDPVLVRVELEGDRRIRVEFHAETVSAYELLGSKKALRRPLGSLAILNDAAKDQIAVSVRQAVKWRYADQPNMFRLEDWRERLTRPAYFGGELVGVGSSSHGWVDTVFQYDLSKVRMSIANETGDVTFTVESPDYVVDFAGRRASCRSASGEAKSATLRLTDNDVHKLYLQAKATCEEIAEQLEGSPCGFVDPKFRDQALARTKMFALQGAQLFSWGQPVVSHLL